MEKFYFTIDNSLYFGYEDEYDAYEIKIDQKTYDINETIKNTLDFEIDKNGYKVLQNLPEVSSIIEQITTDELKEIKEVIKVIEKMGFIEEKDDDEEINYELEPKKGLLNKIKHFLMIE